MYHNFYVGYSQEMTKNEYADAKTVKIHLNLHNHCANKASPPLK